MASARPVIGTLTGGVPEVIGDAGVLVPPADPPAIAEALARLAEDPGLRAELGKRARARIEGEFTHRDQARRRAALYLELAGRGGAFA